MKNFRTIQEWLQSKPSKEEVEKLLTSINNKEISKARRSVYFMTLELQRIERYKKTTEKMNFTVPEETNQRIKTLKQEIAIISKELPASKPRVVKAKVEEVKSVETEAIPE